MTGAEKKESFFDYNDIFVRKTLFLHHNAKIFQEVLELKEQELESGINYLKKIIREQPDKYSFNANVDVVTEANNLLSEKHDKLRYQVLDQLKEIVEDINKTAYLPPDFSVKLVISPRYKKEDLR